MDYPEDIVKAAQAARAAEPLSDIAALAYAIRQERERCAKIAMPIVMGSECCRDTASAIAAAIRRGSS